MKDRLLPRATAMEELRALVVGNDWLTLAALYQACEMLDLDQLNELVSRTREVDDTPLGDIARLLTALRAERFGR